jgi:uncharacterized protein (TIGR03083 family)
MQPSELLEALASEGRLLAEVAASHLDRPVPTCPEWDVAALVGHQGRVYRWAAGVVAAGGERPTNRGPEPPSDRSELLDWFGAAHAELLGELRGRDPGDPAWTFVPTAPQEVRWWMRRQALESAVHRFDAQLAAGATTRVDPPLALEGIEEFLTAFLPGVLTQRPVDGLTGTFHVHATDAEGEWYMDLDAKEPARHEHAKADTAVRGPASGLYLWLWNRQTPEEAGLETFGDGAVVEAWRAVKV